MRIKFCGVRGSIASPGPDTVKYGGNTSCVYLSMNDGRQIILDAGTGIRKLGYDLYNSDGTLYILLSHFHWDHIQGFPFFLPNYQKGRKIRVFPCETRKNSYIYTLLDQMDGASFPVHSDDLPSKMDCLGADIVDVTEREGWKISAKPLNHPGGGWAFRIEEDGVSMAYVTDNELDPPGKPQTSYDEWVEFLDGVDVLIHDAQYVEADMPHKHGWGHSLVSQVQQLAVDANAQSLVLYHHDPDRTDSELDQIGQEVNAFLKANGSQGKSFCAMESLVLDVKKNSGSGGSIIEPV